MTVGEFANYTPLHYAAERDYGDLVELLIAAVRKSTPKLLLPGLLGRRSTGRLGPARKTLLSCSGNMEPRAHCQHRSGEIEACRNSSLFIIAILGLQRCAPNCSTVPVPNEFPFAPASDAPSKVS